jgi:glycosyltransferase involved in cell wall biosynthesis
MAIRLVVLDDNPHVSWDGRTYPVNATFHRFLAAVLDVPGPDGGPAVDTIVQCVPLRPAEAPPGTLPLDPRLEVVGTAPFDGIAGYLRHAPSLLRRNAGILRPVIRQADLLWLKVPASNAPLAASLARIAGVPRFGYVAGRAADVAAAQDRSAAGRLAARAVGRVYDGLGRVASIGGDRVVVGERLAEGGIVTSLVTDAEISPVEGLPWPATPDHFGIAWAGRVAEGKGLDDLLAALAVLAVRTDDRPHVRLAIVGDGPARDRLEAVATSRGVGPQVDWRGYVADRDAYMAALREADLFVFPSPAEGFPKVVLDAMAAGLPVLARPAGSLRALADGGLIAPLEGGPDDIAAAIERLIVDPAQAQALRRAGSAFAADHTGAAEAARLVARWQARYPDLPWD